MRDSLGRVSSRDLTRDFFQQNPLDPKAWIRARNIPLFGDKALRTLTDLYDEAGWLGWATAAALTARAKARRKADTPELAGMVDWGGWTPGDARAASKLIDENDTPQLQALLDRRLVTINGIEQTRYDQLAGILARGLAAGDSMGTVASNISGYLNTDLAWAEVVARTETRAAVTAASVDFYKSAAIDRVEWLTAWDEACETCQGYQDLGPVDIETGFDGLDGPPGHPNCLCVILPVVGEPEEAIESEILPDNATEVVIDESEPASTMPYRLAPTNLQPGWDQVTEKSQISDDLKKVAEEDLRSAFQRVAGQDIQIAIRPESLIDVMNDGKLKSVFEMPESKGMSYFSRRKEIESDFIGVPSGVSPEVRPIYGVIHNEEYADGYGSVKMIINDEVKDRTSVCVGDSFGEQNPVMLRDVQSGAASMDDLARAIGSETRLMMKDYLQGKDFYDQKEVMYWEVQVHGGVSVTDIAEIRVPRRYEGWEVGLASDHPMAEALSAVTTRGIPITYYD